jgi:riboflavin biosynthesis pyrimidine reductase
MQENEGENVLRLFPPPGASVPLQGLYLNEPFGPPTERSEPFVYANFIASLDGRISLPDPRTHKSAVPSAIGNARDWRLFQELAACADALITTGRYARDLPRGVSTRSFPVSVKPEYADLLRWRRAAGLATQPAVIIVTASLDLPPLKLVAETRTVYVATGSAAEPSRVSSLQAQGVRVLRVGSGRRVEGGSLIEALAREGYRNIAVIGGGELLDALVVDGALDRLYLTLACRMLGGQTFDTLLSGPILTPAPHFGLAALHYDAEGADVEQIFAILDSRPARTAG